MNRKFATSKAAFSYVFYSDSWPNEEISWNDIWWKGPGDSERVTLNLLISVHLHIYVLLDQAHFNRAKGHHYPVPMQTQRFLYADAFESQMTPMFHIE